VQRARSARRAPAELIQPLWIAARIASAGLIAGIALSWKLWRPGSRLYPRAPLFSPGDPPPALEWAALALLLASLALTALGRPALPRTLWPAFPAAAALVALDQSRLQPWVWEYGLVLAASSVAIRGRAARQEPVLGACRSIVAGLYFWSGVQKMNAAFVSRAWPELLGAGATRSGPGRVVAQLGWVVPVVEVSLALALLVPRLRRAAVAGVVAMHACVLLVLVATGENSVVWPWNVAMAALTITLFRDASSASGHEPEARGLAARPPLAAAVTLLVWLLPGLSLVGLWDAYLSAALYAGNTIQAVLVVPAEAVDGLPALVRRNTWQGQPPSFIDLNRWSYDELNVPAYPAERVMRTVAGRACREFLRPGVGSLVVLGRPDWKTGARERASYACADLP